MAATKAGQGIPIGVGGGGLSLGGHAFLGDDTLQRKSQGYVVPDAFTHGSSAQRVRWFRRGPDTGQVKACDTFGAAEL